MLLFGMVGSGIVPLISRIRSEITKQFLCYYEMIQTSDIIVMLMFNFLLNNFTRNLLKKEVSCSFKAPGVTSKNGSIKFQRNWPSVTTCFSLVAGELVLVSLK